LGCSAGRTLLPLRHFMITSSNIQCFHVQGNKIYKEMARDFVIAKEIRRIFRYF
jgi:hypothetical protein